MHISNVRNNAVLALVMIATSLAGKGVGQECVGDANRNNAVTVDELVTAVNNALEGCGFSTGFVSVSGTVSAADGGSFRVWATGDSGGLHAVDADPGTGDFTLLLSPDDWYVLGVGHYHSPGEMHFAGNMAFDCHDMEDDHFYVGDHDRAVNLGMLVVQDDASFTRPEHSPMDQLDHDGDGIPNMDDPDFDCEDIGDHDGDGFYDDDMNHDGHHDDDFDHDGHHDDEHHDGHGPGHMER